MNWVDLSFRRDWNQPLWLVDQSCIEISKLIHAGPNGIVPCRGDPHEAIMVIDRDGDYDYVAGMISEE